jgi:hypothetical protein
MYIVLSIILLCFIFPHFHLWFKCYNSDLFSLHLWLLLCISILLSSALHILSFTSLPMEQPVLRSQFPISCWLTLVSCVGIHRCRMLFNLQHSCWFAPSLLLSLLTVVSCISYFSALKMKERSSCEASVFICHTFTVSHLLKSVPSY